MTQVGGLVPLQVSPDFDKFTRLIMDVQLGHVFKTHIHELKTSSTKDMETRKRRQYTDAYRAIGFAFAHLVANSWGVCGPDLLRFLWAVADHAARNAYSLPLDRILTLSQPSLPKSLMILSPDPPLGEEVTSPSPDGEAALLRAAVTPPESIYSKSAELPSACLL